MTVADEAPAPPLNAQRVGEISKIFEDEGIVAKGSLSSSGDNYASWKMDRDEVRENLAWVVQGRTILRCQKFSENETDLDIHLLVRSISTLLRCLRMER